MSTKTLEHVGLTPEQAQIYTLLIEKGALTARKISIDTAINRSLVYKVLKQLIELKLVEERTDTGKTSRFTALPPTQLEAIVAHKKEEAKQADAALHETLSTLGSKFNLMCGKPTIRFYEGVEGIERLNKDVLHTGAPVCIVRSPHDNNSDELNLTAKKFLTERADHDITTKLIVPIKNEPSSITPDWDKTHHIERRRVPREELLNPAQVVLYGNKTALTSFTDCMITTIIEDASITTTMRMLFDALWEKYSK